MLKASICTIGDELLIGQVVDTNSATVSRAIGAIGAKVTRMVSMPDDGRQIVSIPLKTILPNRRSQSFQEQRVTTCTRGSWRSLNRFSIAAALTCWK